MFFFGCMKGGDLVYIIYTHTHTHTRLTALFSGTTQVSQYQKGKTKSDFTEARDSEWQWHQLGHMQVCTSLQTDNHANAPPLSFLQAGCPSCRPTNSVKALKATTSSTSVGIALRCRAWSTCTTVQSSVTATSSRPTASSTVAGC